MMTKTIANMTTKIKANSTSTWPFASFVEPDSRRLIGLKENSIGIYQSYYIVGRRIQNRPDRLLAPGQRFLCLPAFQDLLLE